MNLFGIEFTQVGRGLNCESGNLDGQYDLVLKNGKYMVLIEVKYKLHSNDIINLRKKGYQNLNYRFPNMPIKQFTLQ